ncbi:hypothetical protein D3C72_1945470 [compost metagenome]
MQRLVEQTRRDHDTLLEQQAGQGLRPTLISLAAVEPAVELDTLGQALDFRLHAPAQPARLKTQAAASKAKRKRGSTGNIITHLFRCRSAIFRLEH